VTTEITHHQATVNGFRMHYVVAGSGYPLVLLHGWPQSWYEWRHVIPALAQNYTVIAPDLRGLGDSEKPMTGFDNLKAGGGSFMRDTRARLLPVRLPRPVVMLAAHVTLAAEAGSAGGSGSGSFRQPRWPATALSTCWAR
jgi:pimeloyl-ACP methyl ester carboxylesterase